MEGYDAKSCNAIEKPYYRPIEAALRWCNLIAHETAILQTTGEELLPKASDFPQWPCLRANAEKIIDAIHNNDLPYGRDGKSVAPGEQVARHRITVRHTDLKAWIAKHHPDQKPKFLFDEIERSTHSSITQESFFALQADRDALKARLDKAAEFYIALRDERDHLKAENDRLSNGAAELLTRERNTLLTIIAVLCNEAKIDHTRTAKAAGSIRGAAASIGIQIGETTIEGHLKKIPNAIGTRMT